MPKMVDVNGKVVLKLRLEQNRTQADLGLSTNTMVKVERSESVSVRQSTADALAQALGVEPGVILVSARRRNRRKKEQFDAGEYLDSLERNPPQVLVDEPHFELVPRPRFPDMEKAVLDAVQALADNLELKWNLPKMFAVSSERQLLYAQISDRLITLTQVSQDLNRLLGALLALDDLNPER